MKPLDDMNDAELEKELDHVGSLCAEIVNDRNPLGWMMINILTEGLSCLSTCVPAVRFSAIMEYRELLEKAGVELIVLDGMVEKYQAKQAKKDKENESKNTNL